MLVRLILAVSATFLATVKAQQTNYGQCGGIGWTGPTTCNSGWYCSKGNDYYYQCIPGTATSTTAKPTTTTPVNTTPTRTTTSSGTSQNTATFRNPIRTSNGSDPFMVYSNGYYYLMTTTWSNLQLTRATTINGLKSATPKVIWTDTTASRCCNFWAPEIHWMAAEGRWFIYYSAGTSGTYDNQRIHTIKSSGTDIGSSTWSYSGRITVPNRDVGSIDGTVLNYGGSSYLVYSSWNGSSQDLFIAQLTTATTAGNCVRISTPTYSWEKIGAAVNEGPAPLYHGGRTWIVFSASLCSGTGYELGRIELTGTNPLDPASWTKYNQPIFVGGNGNYEPGHNGFFSGPSGNIYNVYHASSSSPGQCDGSRYTMVQPVNWNSDGTPNLGTPAPLSQNIPEPN